MATDANLAPAYDEENSDRAEEEEDIPDEFEYKTGEKTKEYNLTPKAKDDANDDTEEDLSRPASPNLLDPNHPLLARFQKTLKEYLIKQIHIFKDDISGIDALTKETKVQHEKLGAESYEVQQIVLKQQGDIDDCVKELETVQAARIELDHELEELNELHKIETNKLLDAEKHELQIRTEMDSVVSLLNKMKKWEHDVQSDLLVNQRISEKSRKDKISLALEKKEQDILLYKLMAEIWRLEGKLETIVLQLRVMEEQREKMAESVALSNIEVEANEADQRCLTKGWQSILVSIASREVRYTEMMSRTKELKLKLQTSQCESGKLKSMINNELIQNQSLTVYSEASKENNKRLEHQLHLQVEKDMKIEAVLKKYVSMEDRLQNDLARLRLEYSQTQVQRKMIEKELLATTKRKLDLEEEILNVVKNKLTQNRVTDILRVDLARDRELNRDQKNMLVRQENLNSRAQREYNFQEMENAETLRLLDEIRYEVITEDAQLTECYKEFEQCDFEINTQRRHLETLRAKQRVYDTKVVECGAMSPLQFKIRQLEQAIGQLEDNNKTMQMFWLREQGNVVEMSERRQEQIKDISLLKKQITILEVKNLKISDEIENFQKKEENSIRSIDSLKNKLCIFTKTLYKKKYTKEELDVMNNQFQCMLSTKLEESEFESLKIKNELSEIIEDKHSLSNELIERNREFLCWEGKILLAVEARKNIEKENGEDGEISKMKSEIHRMNIRYSQLRKAQEKLILDLEHCITRREDIFVSAEGRGKIQKGGANQLRINFSRKIDDMKNKVKKAENEISQYINIYRNVCEDISKYQNDMKLSQLTIDSLRRDMEMIQRELDSHHIDKQMKMDIYFFKQKKLKVYTELARGRSPFLVYKSSKEVNSKYNEEREKNRKLLIVLEDLLTGFPMYNVALTKMHNSLLIPELKL